MRRSRIIRRGGPVGLLRRVRSLASVFLAIFLVANGEDVKSWRNLYDESVLVHCDRQENTRAEMRLRRQAGNLGYTLSPIPEL